MDQEKKNFLIFEVPPLTWMLVILGFSSIPGGYLPRNYYAHYVAHFVEYFVFGLLLARGFAHLKKKFGVLKLSVLAVACILLFAIFDEWRQSFVAERTSDYRTAFFDTVYALLGVCAYDTVLLWFSKKKRAPGAESGQ